MEAIAKTKYLKGSPQKTRLVIDLVRGKNVASALAILKFTNKRAATPIAKTIRSAVANATYAAEQKNIAIDPDDLWIKRCFVDMGPTKQRKRLRPAPQGRAYQERRHYCHITVELSSEAPVVKEEPVKKADSKKSAPKKETTAKKAAPKKKETKPAEVAAEETKVDAPETVETEAPKAVEAEAPVKEKVEKEAAPTEETVAAEEAPAAEDAKADESGAEGGKGDE